MPCPVSACSGCCCLDVEPCIRGKALRFGASVGTSVQLITWRSLSKQAGQMQAQKAIRKPQVKTTIVGLLEDPPQLKTAQRGSSFRKKPGVVSGVCSWIWMCTHDMSIILVNA